MDTTQNMQNIRDIRRLFPVFLNHSNLTYLDSASTTLTPQSVLDAMSRYYQTSSANIFRGLYRLSEDATRQYEHVREQTAAFIGANSASEIIFTKNTTESLNLLASTLLETLTQQSEILVTTLEHHANFVPWQQYAKRHNLTFNAILVNPSEPLTIEDIQPHINHNTRVFALSHVSNVLGTVQNIAEISSWIKRYYPSAILVIDGAQAVGHMKVNTKELGGDFYAFSGHKMFGPTGVGVLWGRSELLDALSPYQFGGEMIRDVSIQKSTFKKPPYRFEAGTPPIAEVIGLGAAIQFVEDIPFETLTSHEHELVKHFTEHLQNEFGKSVHILGPTEDTHRSSVVAFRLDGIHPHDIAQILAEENVCIRAGSHCAMPIHKQISPDMPASARVSFSIYNTKEDVKKCIEALKKAQDIFKTPYPKNS